MAAGAKAQVIIIKKKKRGGHAGHHGGAWKVAYADFVTAMMAFFMVMWLLGSDDATRASIASYFNNPSSQSWRPDLQDKDQTPLGNMTGEGQNVVKGAEGAVPEDLVQRPSRVVDRPPGAEGSIQSVGLFAGEEILTADILKFTVAEDEIFEPGKDEFMMPQAERALKKMGAVSEKYHGKLYLKASYDPSSAEGYELAMARLVAIKHYLIAHNLGGEETISTTVTKVANPEADREAIRSHRIEFIFAKKTS